MRDWLSSLDPGVVYGSAAAIACTGFSLAFVVLVLLTSRARRVDPMQEAFGDLPNMPEGSQR
jgi:hypothetical protein